MQYNKSLEGQAPSCQCMLQGKEVLMRDKSIHMRPADDEISSLKESNSTEQNNPLGRLGSGWGGKPTSKPKTSFPNRRPDGILGHHEILQLYAEWFIYSPSPPLVDTGDEKASCLLSEAGVVGLNREKMSSWKIPSASCPGQTA